MMRLAMSPAAAGLIRSLLARALVGRDRILLTEFRSTDWHSLTFSGERHEIHFRVVGTDSRTLAVSLLAGIEEADLAIPGHFVADIAVSDGLQHCDDGSVLFTIEALTVVDS